MLGRSGICCSRERGLVSFPGCSGLWPWRESCRRTCQEEPEAGPRAGQLGVGPRARALPGRGLSALLWTDSCGVHSAKGSKGIGRPARPGRQNSGRWTAAEHLVNHPWLCPESCGPLLVLGPQTAFGTRACMFHAVSPARPAVCGAPPCAPGTPLLEAKAQSR